MRLSTRGRYGLRVMLELALRQGLRPVMMREIAVQQEISRKYMHNLLTVLKSAGFVRAVRGAAGGYVLAKPAEQIRLGELVEALEGTLTLSECVENPRICPRSGLCVSRDVWAEVSQKIIETLNSITLADLVRRHREKHAPAAMYHI